MTSLAFAKTKQTDALSTVPDQVEVTIHKTFGQHPIVSTSGDDPTTVFNISEWMPHVVVYSSKLSLAPDSTSLVPAVSQTQSV